MLMVGPLLRVGSVSAWVFHIVACMGGCLGCDAKPKQASSVHKLFEEPNNHIRKSSKAIPSEEFWTTSPCELGNSAVQSHESLSSTSTLTQLHDAQGGACSSKNPSEFVNHGLLLWNESRQKWIGNRKPENGARQQLGPKLSRNATYSSVLSSNEPFRHPIPLGEMADFLVNIWEQEGMYD